MPGRCGPEVDRRSNCHVDFLHPCLAGHSSRKTRPGSSAAARRFDAGALVVQSESAGAGIAGRRGRNDFQMARAAGAAGRARDRRPDQDQPARPQIPPDRRGGDARRRQIGLQRPGGASRPRLQPRRQHHAPRAMPSSSISAAARTWWPCWRISTNRSNSTSINYVALRAYNAARGKHVNFNDMSRVTGTVPVAGALIPVLVSLCRPRPIPRPRAVVPPDEGRSRAGQGLSAARRFPPRSCRTGFWPIDFGGALGEPVTRGIEPNCRG